MKLTATRQAIDSFFDGGLEPPQSLVDSLSSLSRELVDARRISSELNGAIRPPSQQPGVSSHRQRFAAAAAGPSASRRRPYDFASGQPTSNSSGRSFRPGGDSPPPIKGVGYQTKIRRLPDENSSDDERGSSAGRLLPDGGGGGGDEENCRPASLALLLDYIMSKFPAASKPLAQPSTRLPDENLSDHGRDSSAGRLQLDEEEGDEENCRPASLVLLLDYIMSKFPAAPKPLAQPSAGRFHVFEAAGFVEESSQRSSTLSWFDHVQFACESTQPKFETKIYEGKSLSSIMPSISKVEKVSASPCQERELKVNSQVYDFMSSKPSDTGSVPMSVRDAAVLEETLWGALESCHFQLGTMTALFRFFGDSGQRWFPRGTENVAAALPSAVAFVTTKGRDFFLSHMVPSITEAQKRNLLSDPPSRKQPDMWQGMCPYIKVHSLGLPRRLGRLSGGPSLRRWHPGDALNFRLLLLHRSALKPPLLQAFYAPEEVVRSPEGVFGGRSLSPRPA